MLEQNRMLSARLLSLTPSSPTPVPAPAPVTYAPPQAPLMPPPQQAPGTGEILKLLQNLVGSLQPRADENVSMLIVISPEPPMLVLPSQSPLRTVTGTISATSTSSRPCDETPPAGQRKTSTTPPVTAKWKVLQVSAKRKLLKSSEDKHNNGSSGTSSDSGSSSGCESQRHLDVEEMPHLEASGRDENQTGHVSLSPSARVAKKSEYFIIITSNNRQTDLKVNNNCFILHIYCFFE